MKVKYDTLTIRVKTDILLLVPCWVREGERGRGEDGSVEHLTMDNVFLEYNTLTIKGENLCPYVHEGTVVKPRECNLSDHPGTKSRRGQ